MLFVIRKTDRMIPMRSFGGDLYFFKERKIFVLPGAPCERYRTDKLFNGLYCPDSICSAEVHYWWKMCVL
jgi:hypothetical protein